MPNAVSSFAAPRNMDGRKSVNVCTILIEIIIAATAIIEKCERRSGTIDNIITDTRFICNPGVMPVSVPKRHPIRIAMKSSMKIENIIRNQLCCYKKLIRFLG